MKNFGFEELYLVRPEFSVEHEEALERAMHAKEVLRDATVTDEWPELDLLAATTSRVGGEYNIKSNPLPPSDAVPRLTTDADTGVVFGREDNGLSNEEVKRCDFTITIPTQRDYPTLNLSHAVAVILYEIAREYDDHVTSDIDAMQAEEKEVLLDILADVLDEIQFQTVHDRRMDEHLLERVIGRSRLSGKEAEALMGIFRKIRDGLEE